MNQPGSIQGQLNHAHAQIASLSKALSAMQRAYDLQAVQLRRAVGIIRDCHRAAAGAATFLESLK